MRPGRKPGRRYGRQCHGRFQRGSPAGAAWPSPSSRFGIGGSRLHYATEPQCVDTVNLGCYRLDRLRVLGGYDESMIINNDDEFNFRLALAGGRIFLGPAIRSACHPRASFRGM